MSAIPLDTWPCKQLIRCGSDSFLFPARFCDMHRQFRRHNPSSNGAARGFSPPQQNLSISVNLSHAVIQSCQNQTQTAVNLLSCEPWDTHTVIPPLMTHGWYKAGPPGSHLGWGSCSEGVGLLQRFFCPFSTTSWDPNVSFRGGGLFQIIALFF